jgi:hypothetical protein
VTDLLALSERSNLMWGDILESLRPSDLRIAPGVATLPREHFMLSAGAPTNDQILGATKKFYGRYQKLIDTTTLNTQDVAKNRPDYVAQLNSNNWQNNRLTQAEKDQTDPAGIGGSTWGDTLNNLKSNQFFTTLGVGVCAELILFVGGFGGIGCMWDVPAGREPPKGYAYATAELGVKISALLNVQATIFNKMPHELNNIDICGLTVGLHLGIGLMFAMFFTKFSADDIIGYSIAAGAGAGGGAAIFGGKIWNFG